MRDNMSELPREGFNPIFFHFKDERGSVELPEQVHDEGEGRLDAVVTDRRIEQVDDSEAKTAGSQSRTVSATMINSGVIFQRHWGCRADGPNLCSHAESDMTNARMT